MLTRIALGVAAVGVAFATVPAGAVGCPRGFYQRPTGLYNPLNGNPITTCYPYPPPTAF